MKTALRLIVERLLHLPSLNGEEVNRIKMSVCKELKTHRIPGNADIINVLKPLEAQRLLPVLRRKASRSNSGVNVVAVMTEPSYCPHGRCTYCPGGPEEAVPQSYTGHEPASMRGAQNSYNPLNQVTSRIRQLRAIGHHVDKVDLIIMGGTFTSTPISYQESFVKGCLEGINGVLSPSFIKTKSIAESSVVKNVGITVETRPDQVNKDVIDRLLNLGVTRVELGVQNPYDDIYDLVKRGHTVEDVVLATKLLKDSGLKVGYHMMPGLPGSSQNRDLEGFKSIFSDPKFKPDMLKIYPTLVVKGTELYDLWIKGDYQPLSTEDAVELLTQVKELVPPWIRIMRIQRDIPNPLIESGVDKSNLRQLVWNRLRSKGIRCRCIRCREVDHRKIDGVQPNPDNVKIFRHMYEASDGLEVFITVEDLDADVLIGLLRLRIPSKDAFRPEIDGSSALVRELHVYGLMVPVGRWASRAWQHKGWGELLMFEAEEVAAEEFSARKIIIMSALGTKLYYKKLGYSRDGVYMSKRI